MTLRGHPYALTGRVKWYDFKCGLYCPKSSLSPCSFNRFLSWHSSQRINVQKSSFSFPADSSRTLSSHPSWEFHSGRTGFWVKTKNPTRLLQNWKIRLSVGDWALSVSVFLLEASLFSCYPKPPGSQALRIVRESVPRRGIFTPSTHFTVPFLSSGFPCVETPILWLPIIRDPLYFQGLPS